MPRHPQSSVLLAAAAAAGAATLLLALHALLRHGRGGKQGKRNKAASGALSPERKQRLERISRTEREDLHKAISEIMELLEEEQMNAATIEQVQAKLRALEDKVRAQDAALEELKDAFDEALHRHQQQTLATLTPLRNEVATLTQQLGPLFCLLDLQKTYGGDAGEAGGKQQQRRPYAQEEGLLASGSSKEQQAAYNFSHLATVATALGMSAALNATENGREGGARASSVDAASPSYIVSDWSQL